jgi:GMP synthase (glutamine-hydrolysing)
MKANRKTKEEEQTPILGICFGAQIITESFHRGSVFFLDEPEIGYSNITIHSPNHFLFDNLPTNFDAYAFHYNQIQSEDITIISKHKMENTYFVQAFEISDTSCYGVQFHPEFVYEEMKALLQRYRRLISNLNLRVKPIIENLPILDNSIILKNFVEEFS